MGDCWALWNLVVFDPNDYLTQNNVAWFLMRDFLRLSPWSKGLDLPQAVLLGIWGQRPRETLFLVIRVLLM